jgi:hypothetical protein
VINNQLPIEFYNNQLNKYTFYSSGKPKKHWGFFLDGEFCCIARMIGNSFETILY